jgi:hypothetical protein
MTSAEYRIESSHPIASLFLPEPGSQHYYVRDRALAIAVAAKATTLPSGEEIRVVHVPTGEVVFRKASLIRIDVADEP